MKEGSALKVKIKLMEKNIRTTTIVRVQPPLSKKRRVAFSYEDDERICLAVLNAAKCHKGKWSLPVFGARWFQSNLIDARTGQNLYNRFKTKLKDIVFDAIDLANQIDDCAQEDLENVVLERLRAFHGAEVELIQVEVSPLVQEF